MTIPLETLLYKSGSLYSVQPHLLRGGFLDLETAYPHIGEDIHWQRDVKVVYIFSETTGESITGNMTAGRIIELSDGTHSVKEIIETLINEFGKSPPEKAVSTLVNEFLLACEKKKLVELRKTPVKAGHEPSKEVTPADVERLIEENAVVIIDEKASFEPKDGSLMTYSVKKGEYLVLTEEEEEILTLLLEAQPLQEILSDGSQKYQKAKQILTAFVCELLNHGLAAVH